mgnify:CR=1 FL=1
MHRIAIIGVGKIGSTVLDLLVQTGDYQVLLIDQSEEGLTPFIGRDHVDQIAMAIEDPEALAATLTRFGCFAVVNCAPYSLTTTVAQAAKAAGAMFGVSPGATERLLDACAEHDLPLLPGAATASEIMALLERGYTVQKFFPAEQAGGAGYLKSIGSPIPQVKFCPTGGISLKNARDYLGLPNILCVGGSWVCPKDKMAAGDWAGIEALAREAASLRS